MILSIYIVAGLTLFVNCGIVIGYMENLPIILKNISESKRVALVLPEQLSVDSFCAGLALAYSLPNAMIFSATPSLPELPFLSGLPRVASGLSESDQLVIKISNKNTQAKDLRYEQTNDGLAIYISPSQGQFTERDVLVLPSAANFDLVIVLGAANFEQLGKIYTENTKLFFNTPTINIDNNPSNEFYCTLNFVNTTASSLCEVVMDIIEGMPRGQGKGLLKEPVATVLLAGIVNQTASFRDPKTTPAALQKASRLVEAGAKQQDIIQHMFKTKPLPLLQLWGRALARLTAYPDKQALMAVVTASDLEKTHESTESLAIVLRDIIEMVTGYSLVAFLAELPAGKGVQVLLAGLPFEKLEQMAQQLSGGNEAIKPQTLGGKYLYVSVNAPGASLSDVQAKFAQLIESRSIVV